MNALNRRGFLQQSAFTAAGLTVSAPVVKTGFAQRGPSETIRVAVAGLRNRGRDHYRFYARVPNVQVTTICDIDERLFPKAAGEIADLYGRPPNTVVDFRDLLDDPEIDVISIATPDHWHALHCIWACQAGKDVYIEKPLAYTIDEGRKMVRAARKYNRVVQIGTNHVSNPVVREVLDLIRDGALGDVYMGRVIVYGGRGNIGHVQDGPVPDGVHWDLFLGPAPYRPFNENRFHYNWHWFWDTSTTEFGNNGVHMMDLLRRGMGKRVHPVGVYCTGGFYIHDSDQEIPNVQTATYEYADGAITEMEVRSWYTNPEGGAKFGAFFYGSKGWMHLSSRAYKTFFGSKDEPGPAKTNENGSDVAIPHFTNFIDCVRSRRWQDLHADVAEGHMSTVISHLGNIAYRTKRKLTFNPHAEKFVNDADADTYLTREYRHPYVVPDEV